MEITPLSKNRRQQREINIFLHLQVNPKLQERFYTSYIEQAVQQALEGWKQHQSNCLFILRKLEGILARTR